MFKYQFRWDTVFGSFDFLMSGLQMTLIISAMTLVLAMLTQRVRLALAPGANVVGKVMLTLRPAEGMPMVAARA